MYGQMGLGRDRWVEVTPSRFAHEREGLEYVRAALPDQDPYRAWTGVEIITDRGRSLDVDLLVIAPAGLFVVELKAWSGTVTGDRYSWAIRHERGVRTESNPRRLNNAKARELKSILRGHAAPADAAQPAGPECGDPLDPGGGVPPQPGGALRAAGGGPDLPVRSR